MGLIASLRRPEHYAWLMVAVASTIVGMGMGNLFSISVFLKPVAAEFDWARGQTAFAYSSAAFLGGMGGIVTGRLADRFSTRPIVLVGALTVGGSLLLLGNMDALWQFYLFYGPMMGAFGVGTFITPLVTNVGFWFTRHRGIAMGAVLAGQSVGGAIMPLLARTLVSEFGWRTAYTILGLLFWAVVLPLAMLLREAPGAREAKEISRATSLDGSSAPPPLKPGAVTAVLCGASILCCYCMSIPVIHLVALATDKGIAPTAAASVLSLMMAASVVARLGIGKVADLIGGFRALFLASGIQTATIFWFTQMDGTPGLYLIAVLFGLGYGGVIPSYTIIVREIMPVHRVGGSIGMVLFFANIGMASGGFGGGFWFDLTGSYTLSYATGALAGIGNLIVVGSLYLIHTHRRAALELRVAGV